MENLSGARWSGSAGEAAWVRDRLSPFEVYEVASVVPGGYEAYARVLHPAAVPEDARPVRWRDVAAWSGGTVDRGTQFHSIALPPVRPAAEPPWGGSGPLAGTLHPPDAAVLAEVLRAATSTPELCFFCLWDGYGWERGASGLTPVGEPSARQPGPIPEAVLNGPRVRLPRRDYLLYTGQVEAVVPTALLGKGAGRPRTSGGLPIAPGALPARSIWPGRMWAAPPPRSTACSAMRASRPSPPRPATR